MDPNSSETIFLLTSLNQSGSYGSSNSTVYGQIGLKGQQYRSITSGISFIPISIIGTVGSILCLLTICCQKSNVRSTIDPLFINLAICTLIFSVFCCPFHAYSSLVGWPNFLITPTFFPLCQTIGFMYLETMAADRLMHAAIALQRFIVIVLSDRCAWLKSKFCTMVLLVAPWLMAAVVYVFPFFHLGGEYDYNFDFGRCGYTRVHSMRYHQFLRSFFFFFSSAAIVVCYLGIVLKLAASHRKVIQNPSAVRSLKMKREIGVTKIAFILCVLFTVCFLPATIHAFVAKSSAELFSPLGSGLVILLMFGKTCIVLDVSSSHAYF
jgi:7 transmembrane receptor (rhodopsin family)